MSSIVYKILDISTSYNLIEWLLSNDDTLRVPLGDATQKPKALLCKLVLFHLNDKSSRRSRRAGDIPLFKPNTGLSSLGDQDSNPAKIPALES